MAGENSAAAQATSAVASKIETITLPEFSRTKVDTADITKYRIRYSKIDLDDTGSVAELEILETKGLAGTDIVVLNKDKFTFMDKYFLIVTYMELIKNA